MSIAAVSLGPEARVMIGNSILSVISGNIRTHADIPEKSDTEHWPYKRYGIGLIGVTVNIVCQSESDRLLHNAPWVLRPGFSVDSLFIIPQWDNVAAGYYYVSVLNPSDFEHAFVVSGSNPQLITINGTGDGNFAYPNDGGFLCGDRWNIPGGAVNIPICIP